MWTDFAGANQKAMLNAKAQMNDYRMIYTSQGKRLQPEDTILFHKNFVDRLTTWFEKDLQGSRVVISHHAPAVNPNTAYGNSPLMPAFNSLDMIPMIKQYQPKLWIYGHTHECDSQFIGTTRVISNQLGYPMNGGFECDHFDKDGLLIEI